MTLNRSALLLALAAALAAIPKAASGKTPLIKALEAATEVAPQ